MSLLSTVGDVAGTVGNLVSTNKTLEAQKKLIAENTRLANAYQPRLNKTYNMPENYDIQDILSQINQGYTSNVNELSTSGVDAGTISALKSNANISRLNLLNNAIGQQKRTILGIKENNINNANTTLNSNNRLLDSAAMMKLNVNMQGNEQLGNAAAAKNANLQGAISESNKILNDRAAMDSMTNRWQDSIGESYLPWHQRNNTKKKRFGGRINRLSRLSRVA
jgi:hypothetical protein